jgi:uncharacterized protein YkwD
MFSKRTRAIWTILLLACLAPVGALASSSPNAGQVPAVTVCKASAHLLCKGVAATEHPKKKTKPKKKSKKKPSKHHKPAKKHPAKLVETEESQSFGVTIELTGSPAASPANPATVSSVAPVPCPNTGLTPTSTNIPTIREAILCLVNQERASNDKNPLAVNEQLARAAQTHSQNMVGENYFEHTSPTGETPLQRVERSGYIPEGAGYVIGENVAWGIGSSATPQQIVEQWIASPDHLANILEGKYRETGIGVYPAIPAVLGRGHIGATYTEEFGVVEDAG